MFTANNCLVLSLVYIIFSVTQCQCELPLPPPSVHLYSPETSFPEYAEVIVKRFGDSLTLLCEIRNDRIPRVFVWNYVNNEGNPAIHEPLHIESSSKNSSSRLFKSNLTFADSGHYICSAPPYSIKKYVLVQPLSACGSGSLWCGARCVFPSYVCDGRRDCDDGADENITMCGTTCGENHLSCSDGRCIPTSACCGRQPLCRQPTCCDEHHAFSREGYVEVEYPALFEDRHGPDDYGFIQSTIYTVTACALIFMIAVVLLVSAICKMHMKRAALRSHAARRYTVQAHRFPPCYEASRLLERDGRVSADISPSRSHTSPVRMPEQSCTVSDTPDVSSPPPPTGIARLGALFSSRYTAVPTQPSEVELQNVRCTSLNNSPSRNRDIGDSYRSPTYCDLNTTDFYFTSPETADCGRELNYMATPLEFFRRRTLNRGILDHFSTERSRPLTLQLGRFQLSIPRFGRRSSNETERRPDTPNISEINIDELDFVRLNENDTYTLNGRTIRLLGANFENYPVGASRPPPYNEAMRYKVFGPPPEYLSRDVLTDTNTTTNATPDTEAANNVELPPCYDDLASGVSSRLLIVSTDDVQRVINAVERNNTDADVSTATGNTDARVSTANVGSDSVNNNNNNDSQLFVPTIGTSGTDVENNVNVTPDHTPLNQIIDNLPAIDCDLNANDSTAVA